MFNYLIIHRMAPTNQGNKSTAVRLGQPQTRQTPERHALHTPVPIQYLHVQPLHATHFIIC